MKQTFSKSWLASKQPRKQRKYRFNAQLHIRRKMMAASLSKDLRAKYKQRSVIIVKGDKVKILVGKHKGVIGEINKVNYKKYLVYVAGAERTKRDGPKIQCPIHPSNIQLITPKLDDKKRVQKLENKLKGKQRKGNNE